MLSTPPTFVLSQDQTLQFDILNLFAETFYSFYKPSDKSEWIKAFTLNYKVFAHLTYKYVGRARLLLYCYSVFKDRFSSYTFVYLLRRLTPRQGREYNRTKCSCQLLNWLISSIVRRGCLHRLPHSATAANYSITMTLSMLFVVVFEILFFPIC